MNGFLLNQAVEVSGINMSHTVEYAVKRFYRDLEMALHTENNRADGNTITLRRREMRAEAYSICVKHEHEMVIEAEDDLGFIYALFFISDRFLGIHPFWFWNDQKFIKKPEVLIPEGEYASGKARVEYRGWFINDEVLLSHWGAGVSADYPWEMAFEALLRSGGNVVIPGTDSNSKLYAGLASSMGLWITHHHAEPLGAEMFLRAYPDKTPSFKENPDLFRGLWEEGVKRQKNNNIIWNLGFRGQGDTPFWENDPMYDTPQKRGELISSIMQEQYSLVRKHVAHPVCCTNLYGETMELYQQGFLTLPENIILVWADNGYGKMVSRRQGNHNPRVEALPGEHLKNHAHGVYYHVSFYDLQAANVLTMIPNSMEFVEKELDHAYDCGIQNMWLINCSNIKPHVYPLDFIASMWNDGQRSPKEHLVKYLKTYYPEVPELLGTMQQCFEDYFAAMLPYGEREDEHAGEQFYNYVVRVFIHGWMRDGGRKACEELIWCAPKESFEMQLAWYSQVCEHGYEKIHKLLKTCENLAKSAGELWEDSLLLQVRIHEGCIRGVLHFASAYNAFLQENYMEAFYELGQAADCYQETDEAMKGRCHGKWWGFYDNDCQTDVKETAYLLRHLMGYVRNLGDGPYFYQWQRMVIYPEKDRKILLLLNEENHLTDEELYQAMKDKGNVF